MYIVKRLPSLRVSSKRPKVMPRRTCSPPNLGSMGGRCFCCCQVLRSVEAAPSGAGFVAPAGRGRRKGAIAAAPPSIGRGVAALPDWKLGHAPSSLGCPFCFLAACDDQCSEGGSDVPRAPAHRWNWVSRRAVPARGSAASAHSS